MSWVDTTARLDNVEHCRRLRTLGALLALAVTNGCRLPVDLPDLFFRWLLLGTGDRFDLSVEVSVRGPFC